MLQIVWHPKALEAIRSFPEEVKGKIGYLIFRLQLGEHLEMPQSRSMSSVGKGVRELRVRGKDGVYRSFYLRLDGRKLVVFHVFNKKSQKTPVKEIDQGKRNLKEVLEWDEN